MPLMLGVGMFWIGAIGCVVMAFLTSLGKETTERQSAVNGWWWLAIICAVVGMAI